jgi:tight adherence protein B
MAQYSMANPMAPGAVRPAEPAANDGGNGSGSRLGDSGLARSAVELAERVVVSRDVEGKLAARLEAAAVPLRPAEWVLLHAAAAIVPSFLLLLLTGGDLPLSMLALLAGAVTPYLYLTAKQSSRRQKFEEQLPTTLQLLAGSLAAGYSLPQAVDTVAREAAEPVSTEFSRAIMESRLAVPIEDALEHVAQRTSSEDFGWVVMAVRIQRQVGGNLAELLTTIAATLRERERLRRQVRVLSAEGRLSAYILGGLPILFALYLFVVRREYLMRLFTDPIGIILLFGGVMALIVGVFWMRRIINVEV